MPYPNDDYISVEDQLRRQQMAMMQAQKGQPYATEEMGDIGNIENIDTQLAQQMGSADYAELLRQGASAQKGAATTHYNPMLDYMKGRMGQEEGSFNYARGQTPQALMLGAGGAGGLMPALTNMGVKAGIGRAQDRMMRGPDPGWEQQLGPFGLTGAERVAVNPGYLAQHGQDGLLSSAQMLDPLATGRGLAQMGQFGLDTGMQLWENTSPHELYKTGLIERGATQPSGTGPGTGGPNAGQMGAGAAAGMLTSYLLSRYAGMDPDAAGIAGGAVGGGVSGGLGGLGAAGASSGSGGAAAGSAGAIAGGAIMGGAGAVMATVASQLIQDEVFGGNKMSGKDVGAGQLYKQYHGSDVDKIAKRAGFGGRDEMLAQPYNWMSKEAREFRAQNPDFDYSQGTLAQRGYQKPEYRPSEWEAWVGGMKDSGYKMKNILDATAFYASERGSNLREMHTKAYNKGEDYWLSPESDQTTFQRDKLGVMKRKGGNEVQQVDSPYHGRHVTYMERSGKGEQLKEQQAQYDQEMAKIRAGEGLLTQEQRQENWAKIQGEYQGSALPWQSQEFKDVYEKEYGGMKEAPKLMSVKKFHKKVGKKSWYERHGQMDKYFKLLAEKTGTGPGAGHKATVIRPSLPTTASVGDRFARMGATQTSAQDKRDIYGQGLNTDLSYRREAVGNTGGEGGHDIMDWVAYDPAEEDV